MQRWSPRGRILKSLASKVKSLALASKPQVLESFPVLGSRKALFFEWLKFSRSAEKFFSRPSFLEIAWKKFLKTFFIFVIGEHLHLCPWSLALSIPVLGLESVCPRKGCPWARIFCVLGLGLEPWVLDSTSDALYGYATMLPIQCSKRYFSILFANF